MELEKHEQHHQQLQKLVNQFKKQFNADIKATGHEMTAEEDGGMHSEEFYIYDLIETKAEGLTFETGGWFRMDTRQEPHPVTVEIGIKANNQRIGEGTNVLRSRYHHDREEWGRLRWTKL